MRKYITLNRIEYNIDCFPPVEKKLYERVKSFYDNNKPGWGEFTNFWIAHVNLSLRDAGYKTEEIIKLPVYKICTDLDGRVGIAHGFVKEPEDKSVLSETGEVVFR